MEAQEAGEILNSLDLRRGLQVVELGVQSDREKRTFFSFLAVCLGKNYFNNQGNYLEQGNRGIFSKFSR